MPITQMPVRQGSSGETVIESPNLGHSVTACVLQALCAQVLHLSLAFVSQGISAQVGIQLQRLALKALLASVMVQQGPRIVSDAMLDTSAVRVLVNRLYASLEPIIMGQQKRVCRAQQDGSRTRAVPRIAKRA